MSARTKLLAATSVATLCITQVIFWLLAFASSGQPLLPSAKANSSQLFSRQSAATAQADTFQQFLPLIQQPSPPLTVSLSSDFGNMITEPDVVEQDFILAAELGTEWMRVELPWLRIEQSPGVYNWERYDAAFDRLRALNLKALVLVHSIPEWASDESCGPITDWGAFEVFLNAAMDRYQDVGKAWEFINEPDGKAPNQLGPTIGCWAPYPDRYAEQLALFYALVKRRLPDALVFFGGLAYDSWEFFDRDFLTNTLESGAGNYFDGISLHYYPINPQDFPTVSDKINEIRKTLEHYLFWNKRIWLTETSMWTNGPQGLAAQKNYIVQEQTRAFCAKVDNIFWFAIRQEAPDPPLHRWLINLQHQPDQGYFTYKSYAEQVKEMACIGQMTGAPANVEGYRFNDQQGSTLYIVWSNLGAQEVSFIAAREVLVLDRDGANPQRIPATNGVATVNVDLQPQYVRIDP
ncbi:MAG TPA: hypothetical protein DCL15_08660 [Chloroflexi bacterium]|nr:hypothetical protein [Chloroflexota bacterium]HHW88820.1 hypothetical protein [Chloroflexota bacterium]